MSFELSRSVSRPYNPETSSIRNIELGEQRWSVPWAMVYARSRYWLRASDIGKAEQGGTTSMLITREVDGFIVDISRVEGYMWDAENQKISQQIDKQSSENTENPDWLLVLNDPLKT